MACQAHPGKMASTLWCLDDRASAAYMSDVAGTYFSSVASAAVDRLQPAAGERVLDVACGGGGVAREAAARGARVVALDVSQAMLHVARRGGGDLAWLLAEAHALPFRTSAFARASCPHGLMFFERPGDALAELRRVVAPGGRIVATVWGDPGENPHERALADAYATHAREPTGFFDALFSLADAARVRQLAQRCGLVEARVDRVRTEAVFPSASSYWQGMAWGRPIGGALRSLPRATIMRIRADALARMEPYAVDEGYRAPMETLVLVAQVPGGAP